MTIEIKDILKDVLQKIKPEESERKYLYELFSTIKKDLEICLSTVNKSFNITLQGSLAKDTFIKGHVDIDIFVLFQPLEVNNEWIDGVFIPLVLGCLQNKYRLITKYASHPYVTAYVGDVEVNIVPAYNVASPTKIISAVDRTPFHTMYIISKLNDSLKNEIRILKHFLLTWNLYGAEISVKGFSGYLTELLILTYGTFLNLLRGSQSWQAYETCIDIENYYRNERECVKAFRNDVMIVVDPVDPRRNAAAAVSLKTFSLFKLLAKLFLEKPSYKFLSREQEPFLDEDSLSNHIKKRMESINSCLIGIEFEVLKPVPDIIWGQLNRVERIIKNALRLRESRVTYIGTWVNKELKKAIVLIEILNCNIDYEVRKGPPGYIVSEAANFIIKNRDALVGPWIGEDGVLYCIRKRRYKPSEVIVSAVRSLNLSSLRFVKCIESINDLPLYDTEFRGWIKQFLDRKIFSNIIELFE
ncbi:MAG: CCA tRNA nucleotidyltransferase [Ignisphaera sp.]|nr:CCA tRNA nucleotidyltransferase [Ignisphaera sp.]MDW8084978.1 CCA tRNA nucleotidyltransferase [Ignisphaera sp.]